MNLLEILGQINYQLSIPTAFILLTTAIYLTLTLGFLQLRVFPKFFRLLFKGIKHKKSIDKTNAVNPFFALFTAMSTSLGMGTIVGPSIAIVLGGPGALFWLIFYAICGAIIKYAEVTYAIYFRTETKDGYILTGPMQYLKFVNRYIASWYSIAMVIVLCGWSSLQANVLGDVLLHLDVPTWVTGLVLAILVFILLNGGAKIIGIFNSALVPIMFVLYVSSSLFILLSNIAALKAAFLLMFKHIFSASPIIGGFAGASCYAALRSGVYKGVFITESGMGTSSIPHGLSDAENPTDQGILAMTSVFVDALLCLLSGMLILVSKIWQEGVVCNTMIYRVFTQYFPTFGKPILIVAISMFVLGTVIGNSFNGRQSFAAITRYRMLWVYNLFVSIVVYFGATIDVPLAWAIIDILLPFAAIPNVIGIIYLAINYSQVLSIKK